MESTLNKPLVGNLVYSLLGKSSSGGWKNKPADWSDIRKDCPTNSIALYAAHKADYSQYDNLGFSVTCTGGYNVYIDGVQYGSTYASGAQCSITWSTSGITTGDDITTPSALKAHKIWVEPATEGDNITNFTIKRVAASGTEQQGVLWAHFNLNNSIKVSLSGYNQVNQILQAITSKNNILHASDLALFAYNCPSLTYCTVINCDNNQVTIGTSFPSCSNIKQISIKNATAKQDFSYTFNNCLLLEKVSFKNVDTSGATNFNHAFNSCLRLKNLPEGLRFDNAQYMTNFLVSARYLNDTVLDVSSATKLKIIGCYGTNDRFMSGFKGLRVSDEAPFDNATAPQINVCYTGMDRNALVQLFNDLPTVTGGQIINITGCTGASNLTGNDMDIAINKGWTITGSRDYVIENGVLTWTNPNIYLQGTGPQYIDTGFQPTANTEMEVLMTSSQETSCGSRVAAYNSAFIVYARTTNAWFALGNYGEPYQVNFSTEDKHIYKLSASQTSCWVDGKLKTSSLPSFEGNDYNIYLFGFNNGGYPVQETYRQGKIYYVKIWDNATLVRYFVPVPTGLEIGNYTVPSNGMFDIVNQQFYANAGTGTFGYGKDN